MNILYELKKNLFTRRTVIVAVAIVLLRMRDILSRISRQERIFTIRLIR